MKLTVYLEIGVRIIILGMLGFFMTFVSEGLTHFFGDVMHYCTEKYCRHGFFGSLDGEMLWGSRHYWYFWTLFCLFAWSVVSFVMRLFKVLD